MRVGGVEREAGGQVGKQAYGKVRRLGDIRKVDRKLGR